jgi:hypothetical protein
VGGNPVRAFCPAFVALPWREWTSQESATLERTDVTRK